jgi:hypothetical protein
MTVSNASMHQARTGALIAAIGAILIFSPDNQQVLISGAVILGIGMVVALLGIDAHPAVRAFLHGGWRGLIIAAFGLGFAVFAMQYDNGLRWSIGIPAILVLGHGVYTIRRYAFGLSN